MRNQNHKRSPLNQDFLQIRKFYKHLRKSIIWSFDTPTDWSALVLAQQHSMLIVLNFPTTNDPCSIQPLGTTAENSLFAASFRCCMTIHYESLKHSPILSCLTGTRTWDQAGLSTPCRAPLHSPDQPLGHPGVSIFIIL